MTLDAIIPVGRSARGTRTTDGEVVLRSDERSEWRAMLDAGKVVVVSPRAPRHSGLLHIQRQHHFIEVGATNGTSAYDSISHRRSRRDCG
jgi:hypothetical protein